MLRRVKGVCVMVGAVSIALHGQSIQPAYPATEYIRMNGQLVVAEHLSPPSTAVNVSVSPENITLGPGQQQQFKAIVAGTPSTAALWSISPNFGTVTQTGLYTAPASVAAAPIVTLIATSQADPTKAASTSITFYDPTLNSSSSSPGPTYPIRGTFLDFYRDLTPDLWALEFQYMKQINIDTVVIVSVGQLQINADGTYALSPNGLLYPSNYLPPATRPTNDRLELLLSLADSQGMNVYLGSLQTTNEWSDGGTDFTALRQWNQQVESEVIQRYGRHPSLKGWYFTQEIWMNWVKCYGGPNYDASAYYGTTLMANWVADLKSIDPTKLATASVVFKQSGSGTMPGLTATELQQWMSSFLAATQLDIIMPQDGQGAQQGAPSITDLPSYFAGMAAAVQSVGNVSLWSTTETFSYVSSLSAEQYPPADANRVQQQVNAVQPYVTGYVNWIFGNDMSQQATYYPVEASELIRRFAHVLNQTSPNYDYIPIQSYQFSSPASSQYPDSSSAPKLTDRTGGGYNDAYTLATWVGFANNTYGEATVQIVGDLGGAKAIAQVRALAMSWSAAGVLHPDQMQIDVSQDGVNWSPFGLANSFPPDAPGYSVMWGEADGSASARYVRWTLSYREWLMLAEIEVIGPQ